MAQAYPVVGVEDGNGIQPRLEINDLAAIPIQFSLFVRAMNNIQDMNNADPQSPNYLNNPNSWWQMGAIHGLPYIPWSGDPNSASQPDSQPGQWQGYCYHGSALFPTWHRPLVLLVEQAVVNEAISIATKLEKENPAASQENWLNAAKTLRFPFWDWTKPETANTGIPTVFQSQTISIADPGGSTVQVRNPLNHYQYADSPGVAQYVAYMGDWKRTYRWANQDENPTQEMYNQAQQAFSQGNTFNLGGSPVTTQPVDWLRGKVASLFTYDLTLQDPSYGPNMWAYFSNVGAESAGVTPPMSVMPSSVEEPHNMVHLDTGGNGTMSINEYAGFDPIFFLHHCNVDRLIAFWEYLYPQYWIDNGWKSDTGDTTPFITDNGSYYQDPGSQLDHATPLEPFPTKSAAYWTSDDTRGLLNNGPTQKYYTYPPIKDPQTGVEVKVDVPYDVTDLSLRQNFQQALYKEYGPNVAAIVDTHRALSQAPGGRLAKHANILLKKEDDHSHLRHFVVTGHVPEFAFPGSYRLQLYLLPKNSQQTPVVINNTSVLGRADADNCPGCRDRRASGSVVRGHMQIEPRIVLHILNQLQATELSAVTTLEHVAVVIRESLGMRLVKPDGTVLAAHRTDPDVTSDNDRLEEDRAPKLLLHSHVISFKHDDASVPLKFHSHTTHGEIGDKSGWKLF